VRLLFFAQITEIESRLRERVSNRDWQDDPTFAREAEHASNMSKRNRDSGLPLANYLNLAQLGRVAHHYGMLRASINSAGLAGELKQLKKIRNDVAHSNEIRRGSDPLASVKTVRDALLLLDKFLGMVRKAH
jgi:hypothetical protein